MRNSDVGYRIRTVFNGSAKAANGVSLNNELHCGPNLLPDLTEVIWHWRQYRFVFVTDIKQMFRQIRIHPDDQDLHLILWRSGSVVTYGMVSSPFFAMHVLRQLAEDEKDRFLLSLELLSKDTYMDDSPSGGRTWQEATLKIQQLFKICKVGGFTLRKWTANDVRLLPANRDQSKLAEPIKNFVHSVLGSSWDSIEDCFRFKIATDQIQKSWTERTVLSKVAGIFGPLGWIAPVLVTAKVFMQQLWLAKVGWDMELPPDLERQ